MQFVGEELSPAVSISCVISHLRITTKGGTNFACPTLPLPRQRQKCMCIIKSLLVRECMTECMLDSYVPAYSDNLEARQKCHSSQKSVTVARCYKEGYSGYPKKSVTLLILGHCSRCDCGRRDMYKIGCIRVWCHYIWYELCTQPRDTPNPLMKVGQRPFVHHTWRWQPWRLLTRVATLA